MSAGWSRKLAKNVQSKSNANHFSWLLCRVLHHYFWVLTGFCHKFIHRRRRWGGTGPLGWCKVSKFRAKFWAISYNDFASKFRAISYFLGNNASKFWAISCRLGKLASSNFTNAGQKNCLKVRSLEVTTIWTEIAVQFESRLFFLEVTTFWTEIAVQFECKPFFFFFWRSPHFGQK